ncbi:uncharacterized protein LOC123655092 [Melitaea cinxia]|uniref:uncharacterized protein LOC123655092 n=1 Tax=Melitaea cinxia TaxID=113334 RepID=UPI001E270AE1|nr:uncharacterized protein LOC123655092 [Melitaea cinxia]
MEDLGSPAAGLARVNAIHPPRCCVKRRHRVLSFRLTQVLTRHGCFSKYLHQIVGREATPACHTCGEPSVTARHTLEDCIAWGPQRCALVAVIGEILSLQSVVRSILSSDRYWSAVTSFCEEVMALKEAAERQREADVHANPLRRRRPGGRRRRYTLLHPSQ